MKTFSPAVLFITLLSRVAVGATPDCIQQIHFTNRVGDVGKAGQLLVNGLPGVSPSYNNILQGCSAWTFTYNSEGFSAISIELDTASNSVTSLVSGPGSFAAFQGTAVSGTNPSTVTTVGTYSGTGYYPWLQVNLTSLTGTGSIDVTIVGWKSPNYVAGTACPTCALKTLPISQLASTTSAQLAGTLSDETGSGLAVFNNSPTFITPALGTPSGGVLTNATGLSGITGLAYSAQIKATVTGAVTATILASCPVSATKYCQYLAMSTMDCSVGSGFGVGSPTVTYNWTDGFGSAGTTTGGSVNVATCPAGTFNPRIIAIAPNTNLTYTVNAVTGTYSVDYAITILPTQ